MAPRIEIDGERFIAWFRVDRTDYKAIVEMDIRRSQLSTTALTYAKNGHVVKNDIKYHLEVQAAQEVAAWIVENLLTLRKPIQVGMHERVEIAFVTVLLRLEPTEKLVLTPVGQKDIDILRELATRISGRIAEEKIHAWKHKTSTGHYLERLRSEELGYFFDQNPHLVRKRDLYRKALGQTFSWKRGRIPYATHERARSYLSGMRLSWDLAGKPE